MLIKAKLSYLRISPRKVRLVADLIRGKQVQEATGILNFTNKKAARNILKLLNSAISNASNFQLNKSDLYVSKILVNEGPVDKRWRARARGQAASIKKRTSHVSIILEGEKKEVKKKVKTEKGLKSRKSLENRGKKEETLKKSKQRPERGREVIRPDKVEKTKRVFRRKAF